jgi:rhamnosyltransferase subunit B
LVTNFPEQLPKDLPAGVKAFSYLPFKEILPRCAAIVYTGGIGTMAQAIQAAIPHLVVPHVNDQPDNALRIERLGLGSRVLPKHYEASTVAKEIRRLVSSTETRARCSKYAAQLDSGFSLDMTCNLLTRLGTNGQPNITPGLLAPAHHPLSTSRLA